MRPFVRSLRKSEHPIKRYGLHLTSFLLSVIISSVEGEVLKELLLRKPVAFGDHKTQTRLLKELSNGKPNEVQCCQHKSTVGSHK